MGDNKTTAPPAGANAVCYGQQTLNKWGCNSDSTSSIFILNIKTDKQNMVNLPTSIDPSVSLVGILGVEGILILSSG